MVNEVADKMDMGVDPYFHRTNTLSTGSRPCVTKDKVKPKGPIPSGRGPVWGPGTNKTVNNTVLLVDPTTCLFGAGTFVQSGSW